MKIRSLIAALAITGAVAGASQIANAQTVTAQIDEVSSPMVTSDVAMSKHQRMMMWKHKRMMMKHQRMMMWKRKHMMMMRHKQMMMKQKSM